MNPEETYMQKCLELAEKGLGKVSPNPLVGSVIVLNDAIIAEGYHEKYGQAHAEVNAINNALKNAGAENLSRSTLYVNLEPCNHFGKTPPCSDLIIRHNIKKVVCGSSDPFPEVNGKGIQKLRNSGIEVVTGILEKECRELNRRFFTFQEKRRPYIILKWAQTFNGYMGALVRGKPVRKQISNEFSKILVHKWRSEEPAIMIGTNTAIIDNPGLDVREYEGENPVRIVIDKDMKLSKDLQLFNKASKTIVITSRIKKKEDNIEYISIDFNQNVIHQILHILFEMNIQSVLVEGGQVLLKSFIQEDLWDEARVFTSEIMFPVGLSAPRLEMTPIKRITLADDSLDIYRNTAMNF